MKVLPGGAPSLEVPAPRPLIPPTVLEPLVESARQRWPGLKLGDQAFASLLWARRPPPAEPGTFG
jgi:hypothetical protein